MDRKELIEALERATGPDRYLDLMIAIEIGEHPGAEFSSEESARQCIESADEYGEDVADTFTGSIDIAMTLLPDVCGIDLHFRKNREHFYSTLWFVAGEQRFRNFKGATAAISICLAALRAREEQ